MDTPENYTRTTLYIVYYKIKYEESIQNIQELHKMLKLILKQITQQPHI